MEAFLAPEVVVPPVYITNTLASSERISIVHGVVVDPTVMTEDYMMG